MIETRRIVTKGYSAGTTPNGDIVIASRRAPLRFTISDDAGLDAFDRAIEGKTIAELDVIFADYLSPPATACPDMAIVAAVTRSLLLNLPVTA